MTSSQAAFAVAIVIGYIATFVAGFYSRPVRVEVREVVKRGRVHVAYTTSKRQLIELASFEVPFDYGTGVQLSPMLPIRNDDGIEGFLLRFLPPETPERKD